MTESQLPEPWLRGTLTELPPIQRAVLHSFESANHDLERWCRSLTRDQFNAKVFGLASVAFQIRHIARGIDRLLTYAEGRELSDRQFAALKTEMATNATTEDLFSGLQLALSKAAARVRAFDPTELERPVEVGRKKLPTTVGGLLVHVAEHTQRHVGQAIITAKVVLANT
jgi:uncharacterized damage-inducible protein DinB